MRFVCITLSSPNPSSVPFWRRNIYGWANSSPADSACVWQGVGVRTCQSSQEIQAMLYLNTVTQHSLVLPGTQHVGAQAPFLQERSTSVGRSTAEGRQSQIYTFMYTIHTSHSLWVTLPQRQTAFIFMQRRLYRSAAICRHTKNLRNKQMQMCFHSFLETQTEKLKVMGILATITSHGWK